MRFDLFIIGGGSGGLAAARIASSLGAKVGLADFVKPSPQGTKWGLGGTCVNVGCIPKKLFHHAALMGQARADLLSTGWEADERPHNWTLLANKIQDHIRSLNWKYKTSLNTQDVEYFNKLASLASPNEIELMNRKGEKQVVTTKNVLIATGGRPSIPNIPGAEHCITSDDIFWMENPPGKTLIVGASYIALECAGFLQELGLDTTVMVRSIFLRGFDQQLANKLADYMKKIGHKFIHEAVPMRVALTPDGKKLVTYTQGGKQIEEVFDTVMFATGRSADTKGLNLDKVGVKTADNGKIICGDDDKTTIPNIYAIGDVAHGRLELTPTAIMAGKLLAQRLFGGSTRFMNYKYVPTTVFTPIEYGCCGYSEEDARAKFGADNIVAYGSIFAPLEWAMNGKRAEDCYAKLVTNNADGGRVVGFHYLGPNAGEITQGFAVAILKGATKEDFDFTVGIHPTVAEVRNILFRNSRY